MFKIFEMLGVVVLLDLFNTVFGMLGLLADSLASFTATKINFKSSSFHLPYIPFAFLTSLDIWKNVANY